MRPPEAIGDLPRASRSSPEGGVGGPSQIGSRSLSPRAVVSTRGKDGPTGSGGDRVASPQLDSGREVRRWNQWRVSFADRSDPGVWIEGRLRFTLPSRWLALLDLENEVLAGDYLPDGDVIEVGFQFNFDSYSVVVGDCVQIDVRPKATEMIDLTGHMAMAMLAPGASTSARDVASGDRRRVGGRFWVLADDDSGDDEVDDGRSGGSMTCSPTPSDILCEACSGQDEEEVAEMVEKVVPPEDPARNGLQSGEKMELLRRVVRRRTASNAPRPWRGPIPKLLLFQLNFGTITLLPKKTEAARERLVTGSVRWEMVARDIFNRFGWRSCNRIGN
ncbi:hypothetical protein VPH35_036115 [Triticum aestivum]